jgi:hypothetical protein
MAVKKTAEEQNKDQETLAEIIQAIDSLETEPSRHISIQIDTSLRDAIVAAQNSGSVAEVTVKIKVKPGPERRVGFQANVSAKLPRPPVSAVMLYADGDGNVHKQDPAQLRLPYAHAVTKLAEKLEE